MKIASYNDGSRDGQLVVVSRDLSLAHYATGIVGRLQQLLDDWNFLSPQLEELSQTLNHGKARHAFAFDPKLCLAPLPRAHYVALVDPPVASIDHGPPTLRIVRGDSLLGPCDRLPHHQAAGSGGENASDTLDQVAGLDFCGQLALITGELAAGTAASETLASIRLVTLASSWHPADPADQLQVQPWGCVSLAPVAVTTDELGGAWSDGRIDLPLEVQRAGHRFGRCPTGSPSAWPVGQLLAECARQRGLQAGSIVGIGMPPGDGSLGDVSIGQRRLRERELDGAARTPYLKAGESVRIEAIGRDGSSLFGAIEPAGQAGH